MNLSGITTKKLITVDEGAAISEVAQKMVDEKVSTLLVTKNKAVVGMVTAEDLLRYLAKIVVEQKEKGSPLETLPYSPIVTEALRELNAVGF